MTGDIHSVIYIIEEPTVAVNLSINDDHVITIHILGIMVDLKGATSIYCNHMVNAE